MTAEKKLPFSVLKFSIITPSFNQGHFIRDSLESVFSQKNVPSGHSVEHIVVDGGSRDETVATLTAWKAYRRRAGYEFSFLSEPDDGMTSAINKGFRMASGDWVAWLNTDDYFLEGALERVSAFSGASSADILYGDCLFVDGEKKIIREKKELDFDFNMLLFYGCFIQSTACFIRRSWIERGHLLDPSYKITMDFEYYLRLAQAGAKFRHIPETLAAFRWHGNNLSSVQTVKRKQERLRAQSEALERHGAKWLARPLFLKGLFRWQQLIRTWQRIVGHR